MNKGGKEPKPFTFTVSGWGTEQQKMLGRGDTDGHDPS